MPSSNTDLLLHLDLV